MRRSLLRGQTFGKCARGRKIELPCRVQLPVVFDQRFDNSSDSGSSTTTLIFPPSLTKQTLANNFAPVHDCRFALSHRLYITFPSLHSSYTILGGKISLHSLQPYFSSTFLSHGMILFRHEIFHRNIRLCQKGKFLKSINTGVRTSFFFELFRARGAIIKNSIRRNVHFSSLTQINRRNYWKE